MLASTSSCQAEAKRGPLFCSNAGMQARKYCACNNGVDQKFTKTRGVAWHRQRHHTVAAAAPFAAVASSASLCLRQLSCCHPTASDSA